MVNIQSSDIKSLAGLAVKILVRTRRPGGLGKTGIKVDFNNISSIQ